MRAGCFGDGVVELIYGRWILSGTVSNCGCEVEFELLLRSDDGFYDEVDRLRWSSPVEDELVRRTGLCRWRVQENRLWKMSGLTDGSLLRRCRKESSRFLQRVSPSEVSRKTGRRRLVSPLVGHGLELGLTSKLMGSTGARRLAVWHRCLAAVSDGS